MAMNKREQAEMDALREDLRIAKALRFTERVEPDVPPPETIGEGLTTGFLFNSNRQYENVVKACSSCVGHSFGDDTRTSTQNAAPLYSSALLAYRACRNEMELRFAKTLADIDMKIEELEGIE